MESLQIKLPVRSSPSTGGVVFAVDIDTVDIVVAGPVVVRGPRVVAGVVCVGVVLVVVGGDRVVVIAVDVVVVVVVVVPDVVDVYNWVERTSIASTDGIAIAITRVVHHNTPCSL